MRIRRIVRRAGFVFGLAALFAGCAGVRGLQPPVERREPTYGQFRWPLIGKAASGFGERNGRPHDGIDILAPAGTEVRAAGAGLVMYEGDGMRGYGKAVVVDHGGAVTTLYAHLEEIRVQSGDVVEEGTVIGTVGNTGNATTSHLHFEVRLADQPVDPEKYLARRSEPP